MSKRERDLLQCKNGEMVAHVDADVLLYSCAFAAQKTQWSHPEYKLGHWEDKKSANAWCTANSEDKLLLVSVVIPEPVSHAVRAYNMTLAKVLKTCTADRGITYLTGNKNFRLDVDPDYKANRKLVAKPYHYWSLKEHILKQPETIHVHGMEADDALGIAQCASHKKLGSSQWSVICTIDKDLDMIRGMHYNWNKDTLYYQAGGDADRCFYRQLIMGDPTDNIKGIPKMGQVSAEAALPDSMSEPYSMYFVVRSMYYEYWARVNEVNKTSLSRATVIKLADDDLYKNAQLLWIMRDPRERWAPPTKPEVTLL